MRTQIQEASVDLLQEQKQNKGEERLIYLVNPMRSCA